MIAPVIVTGASGFIGRALVEELAHAGVPVFAVARREMMPTEGVTVAQVADYSETPVPSGATIIHLAENREIGKITSQVSNDDDSQFAALRALLASPCARFIYVSSAVVYGDGTDRPHRPEEQAMPVGAYAEMKADCERQVLAHAGGVVVRVANVFGRGMSPTNVVSDILRQIPGEGPLEVMDASAVRDFVWLGDVARGLGEIARNSENGIFNVGSGCGTSVGDMAAAALRIVGESHRPVVSTRPSKRTSELVLDVSRTTEVFGWRPEVTLAQGLEMLVREAS